MLRASLAIAEGSEDAIPNLHQDGEEDEEIKLTSIRFDVVGDIPR